MLPTIKIEEELINDTITYKIRHREKKTLLDFTQDEQKVLSLVCEKFKDFNTRQIVDYMHEEIAYKETKPKEHISYNLAIKLNDLI